MSSVRARQQASSAMVMALVLFSWGQSSVAQEGEPVARAECSAPEVGGTMSERTYGVVARAIEDLGKDLLDEAATALQELSAKVSGYERAIVFQTLGHVQAQQDNLAAALVSFEEALATNALPRQAHEDLLLNAGQIYLSNRDFDKGISTILLFLARTCTTSKAEVHLTLASAYAEQEKFTDALEQVDLALAKTDEPQEQWLQLKLALHFELAQFADSAETLLKLIAIAPAKEQNWRQLSGVLMQIEEQEEALAVLAIAERQGFLNNERDLKNLANLYLMLEIPYKAGALLQAGLGNSVVAATAENYEFLSEAWITANEWKHAELALQQAASLADDGKLWQRLAQVRMEREDWSGAREALEQALVAGVADAGETNYLLGVAAYSAGDTQAAMSALQASIQYASYRQQAQQWLTHLQNEQRRLTNSFSEI